MVWWRVSSHERDNDRFVLRSFAKQPCCTCASSSGSSAGRADHDNACHASHSSKSCASHSSICGPGTARRASSHGISSTRPPERSSARPLVVITPLQPGWVFHLCQILPIVLLPPPAVFAPGVECCKTRPRVKTCQFSPGYVRDHPTTGDHRG